MDQLLHLKLTRKYIIDDRVVPTVVLEEAGALCAVHQIVRHVDESRCLVKVYSKRPIRVRFHIVADVVLDGRGWADTKMINCRTHT